ARHWRRPHPVWGADWEFLSHSFPHDFEQTILRKPFFARVSKHSHHPDDPPQFWGWRWICPTCNQPVKSIYYPIAVPKMLDRWIEDSPMEQMLAQFPGGADIPVCHPSVGADIPVCHPSGGADIPVCHPSGGADIPVC